MRLTGEFAEVKRTTNTTNLPHITVRLYPSTHSALRTVLLGPGLARTDLVAE